MKCKFWKKCPLYSPSSVTCNKTGGMYYDTNRGGGCYREMSLKVSQNGGVLD